MTPKDRGILLHPAPKLISLGEADSELLANSFRSLTPTRTQLRNLPDSISLVPTKALTNDQSYRLVISANSVELEAQSEMGWHYGLLTLQQLASCSKTTLPKICIEDSPDFLQRGIMLDVSRNKVPKLESLLYLIDLFAHWKINELQLYIEHAFAYEGHDVVWHHASPLTKEDIHNLDTYCNERFIELVPNLNCFGHMSRWLIHEPYKRLAEQPEGGPTDLGVRKEPQGLCATDPGSIQLAEDLIQQMTACFKSEQVNVGCDETIDLGYGRSKQAVQEKGRGVVYLDYLKKVHSICEKQGKTMQYWSDIILKYPDLISKVPENSIALDWGYEAIHPFEKETLSLQSAGTPFYVCPGTSSWNSIGGRTENMLANIGKAAACGLQHGAVGLMTTDWGDNGHVQPLLTSFPGFIMGAAMGWNQSIEICLPEILDRYVFEREEWGQLILEIGNLDKPFGIYIHNQSLLFQLLKNEVEFIKNIEGLTIESLQHVLSKAKELHSRFLRLRTEKPIEDTLMLEFEWVLEMLIHATQRGIAIKSGESGNSLIKPASQLREKHKKLWDIRNRPGGYELTREFFDHLTSS